MSDGAPATDLDETRQIRGIEAPEAFQTTVIQPTPGPGSVAPASQGRDGDMSESDPGTPRPSLSCRWQGTTLDHYDVAEALGRGGMGAVYKGRDRSLDREVAIKILPEELADDEEWQQRFIREGRAQARLVSTRVVHIYFIGHTPEGPGRPRSLYFAMELVAGGSLAERLEAGERIDPERARQLMMEAAEGLRAAHRAGIVHRDIKPGNLLLDSDGHIKIADFGVAKPTEETDSKLTHDGMVIGSPLYMPPEQAKGLEVDHLTDMYALGACFHHLVSGEPPFDGPTPLAVVSKHMTEPPAALDSLRPEVPKALAAIVLKLMAKEPADRYATYDELIEALDAAAPGATRPASFWARMSASAIDALLIGVTIAVAGWIGLVVQLAYLTAAHARWGQTLGKRLLHLQVQRVDGSAPSLVRSAARTVASMWLPFYAGTVIALTEGLDELKSSIEQLEPSQLDAVESAALAVASGSALLTLLYLAGLAMAAFHPQRRAAHDLVAGTRVVYRMPQ